MTDAVARFRDATRRLEELTADSDRWAQVRREAVRELVTAGWSYRRIADELGLSKGRVSQMVK